MTLELVRLRVTCVQILHACHPVHRLVKYRRRLGWHTALGHGRNRCAWRSNESEPQRGVQSLHSPVAVSALCNAMNTIALGLMALMRFESKSSLHTQGACTLQSLKVQQLELRDKLHLCTS